MTGSRLHPSHSVHTLVIPPSLFSLGVFSQIHLFDLTGLAKELEDETQVSGNKPPGP